MFREIAGCALVAVADISPKRAAAVAGRYGVPHVFSSMEEMLDGVSVDAVSIVTTDASHVSLAIEALRRGKHVLCEKPLATNAADAFRLADTAKEAGFINMVNLSYRSSPAIQKAYDLVQSGAIGPIVHVEASYLQDWLGSSEWRDDETSLWRLSSRHGSKGVLSDLGIHVLDFASYPIGKVASVNCRLHSFDTLKGMPVGDYDFEASDSAVLHLEFQNGALGVVHTTRWGTGHKNSLRLRVYGERGGILIDLDASKNCLWLCNGPRLKSARWQKVRCPRTPNNYARFISSIESGINDQPDFAHGAQIQRILDCCEQSSQSGATVRVENPETPHLVS
jgi:predicted dehydrogenase